MLHKGVRVDADVSESCPSASTMKEGVQVGTERSTGSSRSASASSSSKSPGPQASALASEVKALGLELPGSDKLGTEERAAALLSLLRSKARRVGILDTTTSQDQALDESSLLCIAVFITFCSSSQVGRTVLVDRFLSAFPVLLSRLQVPLLRFARDLASIESNVSSTSQLQVLGKSALVKAIRRFHGDCAYFARAHIRYEALFEQYVGAAAGPGLREIGWLLLALGIRRLLFARGDYRAPTAAAEEHLSRSYDVRGGDLLVALSIVFVCANAPSAILRRTEPQVESDNGGPTSFKMLQWLLKEICPGSPLPQLRVLQAQLSDLIDEALGGVLRGENAVIQGQLLPPLVLPSSASVADLSARLRSRVQAELVADVEIKLIKVCNGVASSDNGAGPFTPSTKSEVVMAMPFDERLLLDTELSTDEVHAFSLPLTGQFLSTPLEWQFLPARPPDSNLFDRVLRGTDVSESPIRDSSARSPQNELLFGAPFALVGPSSRDGPTTTPLPVEASAATSGGSKPSNSLTDLQELTNRNPIALKGSWLDGALRQHPLTLEKALCASTEGSQKTSCARRKRSSGQNGIPNGGSGQKRRRLTKKTTTWPFCSESPLSLLDDGVAAAKVDALLQSRLDTLNRSCLRLSQREVLLLQQLTVDALCERLKEKAQGCIKEAQSTLSRWGEDADEAVSPFLAACAEALCYEREAFPLWLPEGSSSSRAPSPKSYRHSLLVHRFAVLETLSALALDAFVLWQSLALPSVARHLPPELQRHLQDVERELLTRLIWRSGTTVHMLLAGHAVDFARRKALQPSRFHACAIGEDSADNHTSAEARTRVQQLDQLFEALLHQAGSLVSDMAQHLQLPPVGKYAAFDIARAVLLYHIGLVQDRHLDQIVLCAVYAAAKIFRCQAVRFNALVEKYALRTTPKLSELIHAHVVRGIPIFGTSFGARVGAAEDGTGDLVEFYNTIFMHTLKPTLTALIGLAYPSQGSESNGPQSLPELKRAALLRGAILAPYVSAMNLGIAPDTACRASALQLTPEALDSVCSPFSELTSCALPKTSRAEVPTISTTTKC